MDRLELLELLRRVKDKDITPEGALDEINLEPYHDLGDVKLDFNRAVRRGFEEIIYCPGKDDSQLLSIGKALREKDGTFLFSRISEDQVKILSSEIEGLLYHPKARLAVKSTKGPQELYPGVTVVCAGSSDVAVAEEAALTSWYMGCSVKRLYDVGVAGLHRLLSHAKDLMDSRVIVAVAGMEGALPSVVAGLVSCPVVAVPTSVGYGAALGGMSALLSMLNSCATGVSVVNIDNGLGGGYMASMIARQCCQCDKIGHKPDREGRD